jgi:hypothetical protein
LPCTKSAKSRLPTAAGKNRERRVQATILRTFEDTEEKHDAAVADRQGLGLGEEKVERQYRSTGSAV